MYSAIALLNWTDLDPEDVLEFLCDGLERRHEALALHVAEEEQLQHVAVEDGDAAAADLLGPRVLGDKNNIIEISKNSHFMILRSDFRFCNSFLVSWHYLLFTIKQ